MRDGKDGSGQASEEGYVLVFVVVFKSVGGDGRLSGYEN